jgi:ApaG protein
LASACFHTTAAARAARSAIASDEPKRWYHELVNTPESKPEPQQPAATSEAITNNVRVEVESQYRSDQSQPFHDQWVFQYSIRITNEGHETVQLLSRHWIITDAMDHVEEVKGSGVVGEQPILAAGESFEYSSWCRLKTPTGVMRGTYQMVSESGKHFDVEIAPFAQIARYTIH